MKKHLFKFIGFLIAVTFWFFESVLHYFVFNDTMIFDVIPQDSNEFWMRLVIVSLIILFGFFTDTHSNKMIAKEKDLEALKIYNSMIYASHHILNNLLNQMMLFKLEAENCNDFDLMVLKHFDNAIEEATDLIEKLSQIEKITGDNIWASVDPNKLSELKID